MLFIDRTYFTGEINIPNVNTEVVGSLLDAYIAKYEPEFFLKLMGPAMYDQLQSFVSSADFGNDFSNDFSTGGYITTDPASQKWIDLIVGKTYTYYSRDYNYFGLAPRYSTNDVIKESPIANYIYYWFMRGLATQTTSGGEVKSTFENSVSASPGEKMAKAWNEISKWERDYRQFVNAYPLLYPYYNYYWGYRFEPINEFNI